MEVLEQILAKDLVFTIRVHLLQSIKDSLGPQPTNITLSYQKVRLEVVFGDDGVVVEGDVDTGEDEIFG